MVGSSDLTAHNYLTADMPALLRPIFPHQRVSQPIIHIAVATDPRDDTSSIRPQSRLPWRTSSSRPYIKLGYTLPTWPCKSGPCTDQAVHLWLAAETHKAPANPPSQPQLTPTTDANTANAVDGNGGSLKTTHWNRRATRMHEAREVTNEDNMHCPTSRWYPNSNT